MANLFIFSFLIPLLVGVVLLCINEKKGNMAMFFALAAALVCTTWGAIKYFLAGMPILELTLLSTARLGVIFGFLVDPMGVVVALVIVVATVFVMIFSTNYMTANNRENPVREDSGRFNG